MSASLQSTTLPTLKLMKHHSFERHSTKFQDFGDFKQNVTFRTWKGLEIVIFYNPTVYKLINI